MAVNPNNLSYEEMVAAAIQRAATEVNVWYSRKNGDSFAGEVVELGDIVTAFGRYATTTLKIVQGSEKYVEDGKVHTSKVGDLFRVAWMGAVLQATYERMQPSIGDFVAFHQQKMVKPKSGMKEYPLTVAVVIDGNTRQAKKPVNIKTRVPTERDLVNADPETGEIKSDLWEPFPDENEEDSE